MSLAFADNLSINMKKQNVERDSFKTIAAMKAFPETSLPAIFTATCEEDGLMYIYNEKNDVDATIGKWRKLVPEQQTVEAEKFSGAVAKNVGALEAGDELTDVKYGDFANMICGQYDKYSYEVSVDCDEVNEVGTSVDPTLSSTITKGTASLTEVSFYKDDTLAEAKEAADGGAVSHKFETITADTVLKLVVGDGKIKSTKSVAIKFVNATYHGVVAADADTTDSSVITALTKELRVGKDNAVTDSLDNQKFVYAYPKTYGELTNIEVSGINYIDSFTKSELKIGTVDYLVYVMTDAVTVEDATFDIK